MIFVKFNRVVSGVLASSMLLGLMAGCGGNSDSASAGNNAAADSGAAQTGEPSGSVRILCNVTGGKDDAEMKLFQEALSEATGLDVQMEKPASDYDNVLMQKLQGGEEYDLIYIGASQYMNLVEQGALMDITDRVKASDILSNNIDQQEWDDITVDGKVYAGFNKKELHRVVQLNKNDLEAVGIDYKSIEPTLDGYYEVFKALRAANASADYYPLNCVMSESYDLQPWFASLGLQNGVVVDEADGKTYAPYSTDEAAPVWEWFKKLYDEKLLDPASFVDKTKDMRAKMEASSKQTSVVVDWAMWTGLHNAHATADGVADADYEIVNLPGCKTPAGSEREYMLVKGGASLFAVPANAKNVDGAIKVLEYFATQEGGELLSIGIEGNDYTKSGSTYTQTALGADHANDHGAPIPIYKDFVNPLGYNRGVEEALTYLPYARIDRIIPDETTYKTTVGKWGIEMIKGNVSVADGLASMRKELVSLGLTEK